MKGIILAGGSGSRLYPVTLSTSKQLLPVYDKPMIYYPLSVLMLAGIKDILIISKPDDRKNFYKLFGDGSKLGISITYEIQEQPNGIAEAFIIGREFIENDDVCLILGDNIFYGALLSEILSNSIQQTKKTKNAVVFGYSVNDPSRYGVAEIYKGKVISIEEKPEIPKSQYAVVGLYFYPNDVVEKVLSLKPSPRGELEISDLNNMYINEERLQISLLGRGYAWLDAGTHEALLEATEFVRAMEKRTGLKIACLEEIAYNNNWIDDFALRKTIETLPNNLDYKLYLNQLLREYGGK